MQHEKSRMTSSDAIDGEYFMYAYYKVPKGELKGGRAHLNRMHFTGSTAIACTEPQFTALDRIILNYTASNCIGLHKSASGCIGLH